MDGAWQISYPKYSISSKAFHVILYPASRFKIITGSIGMGLVETNAHPVFVFDMVNDPL